MSFGFSILFSNLENFIHFREEILSFFSGQKDTCRIWIEWGHQDIWLLPLKHKKNLYVLNIQLIVTILTVQPGQAQ